MPVTATNLLQGPATLYLGAFGVTEPATIATTPGAGWTDVGGTQDGVTVSVELEFSELMVDQIIDIPGVRVTKRVTKLKTNFAEATLAMWAQSLNELAGTVASNKFTPSNNMVPFSPNYVALLLDGFAPGGFRRRLIIRKALQVGSLETAYKKDSMTLLPVEFSGNFVSSTIAPFSIEDATS